MARRALAPDVQTAAIVSQINQLQTSGVLSGGQAASLTEKLDAITARLNRGNTTPLASQLGAFVNQVRALRSGGVRDSAQGLALIDTANAMIARLTP